MIRRGSRTTVLSPWYMWASNDNRGKCFMIKVYVGEHTCKKEWEVKRFIAKFLAEKYIETSRAHDRMTLRNFPRTVQKEFNMTPSRSKLGGASRIAIKAIHGDEVEQYNKLWDYATELRRSNLSGSFFLNLHSGCFSTFYVCLDACKIGFPLWL